MDLGVPAAITGLIMSGYNGDGFYIRTFTVQYRPSAASDEWQNFADAEGKPIQVSRTGDHTIKAAVVN